MEAKSPVVKITFEDGTEEEYTHVDTIDVYHDLRPLFEFADINSIAYENYGYTITIHAMRRKINNA